MKSILKKIGLTLGSLLLSFNIGCDRYFYPQATTDMEQRAVPLDLEDEISFERPRRLKAWQYPVNLAGGFFIHILTHEGGHAATALAHGVEIEKFHPYPGFIHGKFHGGWVCCEPETYQYLSNKEKALISIVGPAADITLAEIINYNLRNGKVSEKYQSFWATTSLMARGGPLWIAFGSLKDSGGSNDFYTFEKETGIQKETMASLVFLYTALNYKRIAKEFRVALGTDSYPVNEKQSRVDLVPYKDGLMVNYTLDF